MYVAVASRGGTGVIGVAVAVAVRVELSLSPGSQKSGLGPSFPSDTLSQPGVFCAANLVNNTTTNANDRRRSPRFAQTPPPPALTTRAQQRRERSFQIPEFLLHQIAAMREVISLNGTPPHARTRLDRLWRDMPETYVDTDFARV